MPNYKLSHPGPLEPWTKIPNFLLDELMGDLKDTELRLYLTGLRMTVGWNRDDGTCNLSMAQLIHRTGRRRDAVNEALARLRAAGLIHMVNDSKPDKARNRRIQDQEFQAITGNKVQRKERTRH